MYHSVSVYTRYSDNLFYNLGTILAGSIAHNSRCAITGALAFIDHQFAQILEGPENEVEALYERISQDCRHHQMRLVLHERCIERAFPTWSMAYIGFEANLQPMFNSLAGRSDLAPDVPAMIRNLATIVDPPSRQQLHA